jgi:hypothetical protein
MEEKFLFSVPEIYIYIYIRGPGPPDWGSLESETENKVMSPMGIGPENDCAGEDQTAIEYGRSVLSPERAPHINKPQLSDRNKNPILSPRWVLDTKADWPTDRRS